MNIPKLSRPVMPRIADINCSKIKFDAGDRIIVRSFHRMDTEQIRKLKKSICKWAGVEVEIFVICLRDFDMVVDK